jgi:hypothetical protein
VLLGERLQWLHRLGWRYWMQGLGSVLISSNMLVLLMGWWHCYWLIDLLMLLLLL